MNKILVIMFMQLVAIISFANPGSNKVDENILRITNGYLKLPVSIKSEVTDCPNAIVVETGNSSREFALFQVEDVNLGRFCKYQYGSPIEEVKISNGKLHVTLK
jgi:hypothetical protein